MLFRSRPVLCDLRNLYDPAEVEAAGFTHVGVGRGRIAQAPEKRRRAPRQVGQRKSKP